MQPGQNLIHFESISDQNVTNLFLSVYNIQIHMHTYVYNSKLQAVGLGQPKKNLIMFWLELEGAARAESECV